MFWGLIIRLLGCGKKDYLKHIRIGKEIFVINIRRHISIEEIIKTAADNGVYAADGLKEVN